MTSLHRFDSMRRCEVNCRKNPLVNRQRGPVCVSSLSVLQPGVRQHRVPRRHAQTQQRDQAAPAAGLPVRTVRYSVGFHPHGSLPRVQAGSRSWNARANSFKFALGMKERCRRAPAEQQIASSSPNKHRKRSIPHYA